MALFELEKLEPWLQTGTLVSWQNFYRKHTETVVCCSRGDAGCSSCVVADVARVTRRHRSPRHAPLHGPSGDRAVVARDDPELAMVGGSDHRSSAVG